MGNYVKSKLLISGREEIASRFARGVENGSTGYFFCTGAYLELITSGNQLVQLFYILEDVNGQSLINNNVSPLSNSLQIIEIPGGSVC